LSNLASTLPEGRECSNEASRGDPPGRPYSGVCLLSPFRTLSCVTLAHRHGLAYNAHTTTGCRSTVHWPIGVMYRPARRSICPGATTRQRQPLTCAWSLGTRPSPCSERESLCLHNRAKAAARSQRNREGSQMVSRPPRGAPARCAPSVAATTVNRASSAPIVEPPC